MQPTPQVTLVLNVGRMVALYDVIHPSNKCMEKLLDFQFLTNGQTYKLQI